MNDRQKRFVAEYVKTHNATKSAISAGYSVKSAHAIGTENLSKPAIAQAVAKACNALAQRLEVSAERVLLEMARLAFYDPRNFFLEDGSAKPITELDDDTAMALAGMDIVEIREDGNVVGHIKKYKLADKGAALERLGRHLGLFADRTVVEGGFEITVRHIESGEPMRRIGKSE